MLSFITEWSFGIVNVRTDEQWPKSPRRPFATFQAGLSRGDIALCEESGEPHAESPIVDPDRIRECCWPAAARRSTQPWVQQQCLFVHARSALAGRFPSP